MSEMKTKVSNYSGIQFSGECIRKIQIIPESLISEMKTKVSNYSGIQFSGEYSRKIQKNPDE